MIIFLISIISFVLEFLFVHFNGSIFSGLIIFTTIILLEPYFKKNKYLYFFYCFIVGFLYDYIYTGTYFMNAGLFLLVGLFVDYLNGITPNNLFVSMLELVVLISLYRIFSFFFFCLNGIIGFDIHFLFKSIYSSFLLNIMYGLILYFVLFLISLKFKIKRIN